MNVRWLKWESDIVGIIDATNAVHFVQPEYNAVVAQYTHGSKSWTPEQFSGFLSERIVSRDRRDIERILFRCKLSHYDVMRIAEITRGINPRDLLWVAHRQDECLEAVITDVFDSVFHQRIDLVGDTIDTPEGYNIKRYGAYHGQYGIYKQRMSPLSTDVESEVAAARQPALTKIRFSLLSCMTFQKSISCISAGCSMVRVPTTNIKT